MPKQDCKMTEVDFIGSVIFKGERYIITELKTGEHLSPDGSTIWRINNLTAVRFGKSKKITRSKLTPKKRKKGSSA